MSVYGIDPDTGLPREPAVPESVRCPDGGACHHECATACFRVRTCGPLSGVYPRDQWPAEVYAANDDVPASEPDDVPALLSPGTGPVAYRTPAFAEGLLPGAPTGETARINAGLAVTGGLGTVPWMTPVPDNDWGRLALHLASDHADPLAVQRGASRNIRQHGRDHDGSGPTRPHNHPRGSRHFDLAKARAVIMEALMADWEGQ